MSLPGQSGEFASLGPLPFMGLAPVFLVGTYDESGMPNIMAAVMGGLCCVQPPCLTVSIEKSAWTRAALEQRKAFTINVASCSMAAQLDFCGLVSGRNGNKFSALGLTPLVGEHVDAPYVAECPVVVELLLRHVLPMGSHTQYVGEIMDVKVRRDCLTSEGEPDPRRIDAMTFLPLKGEYYGTGNFVARAFAVGKTIMRLDGGTTGKR